MAQHPSELLAVVVEVAVAVGVIVVVVEDSLVEVEMYRVLDICCWQSQEDGGQEGCRPDLAGPASSPCRQQGRQVRSAGSEPGAATGQVPCVLSSLAAAEV